MHADRAIRSRAPYTVFLRRSHMRATCVNQHHICTSYRGGARDARCRSTAIIIEDEDVAGVVFVRRRRLFFRQKLSTPYYVRWAHAHPVDVGHPRTKTQLRMGKVGHIIAHGTFAFGIVALALPLNCM